MAGMSVAEKQAEEGMKLFKAAEEPPIDYDLPAAQAFKAAHDAKIEAMEKVIEALTGKDNKKERTARSRELHDMKNIFQYIDACKVCKGLPSPHSYFIKKDAATEAREGAAAAAAAAAKAAEADAGDAGESEAKKKEKKTKKEESAGISAAERDELEKLKNDIIARKAELKAEGKSGGEQNKDAQVSAWVNRMNELKEKQEPGSTLKKPAGDKDKGKAKKKGLLSSEEQKEMETLRNEIEVYKGKLKAEFGYSNKDMKADPDLTEMEAKLAAFEKRA
jgi:hypothetical protein